jgi:multidrug efflux pump subunit AcrB
MAHSSDLVMHVDETLMEDRRHAVEDALNRLNGVNQAQFNATRPHLMLVSYNPFQISSFEIMAKLSGQNLCAERVG